MGKRPQSYAVALPRSRPGRMLAAPSGAVTVPPHGRSAETEKPQRWPGLRVVENREVGFPQWARAYVCVMDVSSAFLGAPRTRASPPNQRESPVIGSSAASHPASQQARLRSPNWLLLAHLYGFASRGCPSRLAVIPCRASGVLSNAALRFNGVLLSEQAALELARALQVQVAAGPQDVLVQGVDGLAVGVPVAPDGAGAGVLGPADVPEPVAVVTFSP